MSHLTSSLLLPLAILLVVLACIHLLRKAGGGKQIVTITRNSPSDVETTWRHLHFAWQQNGLTFKPSHFIDIDEPEKRYLVTQSSGVVDELLLRRLPPPGDRSIVFSVMRRNSVDNPDGERHFEHWSVEARGSGSRIVVQTRFISGPWQALSKLLGLWRQAGILTSPTAETRLASIATLDHVPVAAGRPSRAGQPGAKRRAAPLDLSSYGREAAISLFAFAYLLIQYTWQSAVVLALVILWHEYGHLLAYRLTGRTGNRLMLVPFFGGVAVAGAPHKSEFEKAFCALMGPAICAPLTIGAFIVWYYTDDADIEFWAWKFMTFSAALNLLNLLPIYPLDGGHTAESFLRSFLPGSILVHLSGLSVAGLVVLAGLGYYQMMVFIGIFCLMSIRTLPPHSPLPAMSRGQAVMMATFYAIVVAAHGAVFYYIS
jgi:Zn-dependent protease